MAVVNRKHSPLFLVYAHWHVPMLALFMVLVLLHFAEHILQMFQLVVLGWPRPASGGLLGLAAPELAMSEFLHLSYNAFQWMGLAVLMGGFQGRARHWWRVAFVVQCWHLLEHILLQFQWLVGIYLYNGTKPMSVLEFLLPRIELHFIYNVIVFIPTMIALVLYISAKLRKQ